MNINIEILPPETENTFSKVNLKSEKDTCILRNDYETFNLVTNKINEDLLDLLLLSNTVYAIDRWKDRKKSRDHWTREFNINFPVNNKILWNKAKIKLNTLLSFLSGDSWNFNFIQRHNFLVYRDQEKFELKFNLSDAVSLFSGGLDSLVGVINWLETNPQKKISLIGHHDPRMAGPYSDQLGVLENLKNHYPNRINDYLITVGANKGTDTNLRARSFLFIVSGIYIANSIGDRIPLIIPENGTMAINFPLTPSRLGSNSTRTVHPYYIKMMKEFFNILKIDNEISNPLEMKTKGEVLAECLNQEILNETISKTTSCSKRGHTRSWINRQAKQCGTCIPCIYRRAALHKIGIDTEVYGRDFCRDEVEIFTNKKHADDLRAYLSFLRQDYNNFEIKQKLLINGKLSIELLNQYSDIVKRSGNEVRQLLIDNASDEIKKQAGII